MNHSNIINLYSILNNEKTNKYEIQNDIYYKWESLNDIYKILDCGECRLAYFDEEDEFISILDSWDFSAFHSIILKKAFTDDKVLLVAYNINFDNNKLNTLQKFRYLIQSMRVYNQDMVSSVREKKSSFLDEITSSSSSSIELSKSKRHRSIKRYSADIKKELNWLTGSEVTDGETIVKKWKIKNTGSKKWKANAVKCVLLPSEYSNWVKYYNINVPVCFADQKVDMEMEITIVGKWPEESSNSDHCPRIKLKWLLFMDKLVRDTDSYFIDYILAQLELVIRVRPAHLDCVYKDNEIAMNIKTALSESSIEKIDQDFSIVDISDEDENKKVMAPPSVEESKNIVNTEDLPTEIDIELPDCPNGDDFQITDFHEPDLPISTDNSSYERRKISYKGQYSVTNVMAQSDVLINIESPDVDAIENSSESLKKNYNTDDDETTAIKAKSNELDVVQPEPIQNDKDIGESVVMISHEIEANLIEQNKSVQNEDVNINENSTDVNKQTLNDSVEKQTEITKPTDQVSIPEPVVLILDNNLQGVQDIVNTANENEIIVSESNPAVIGDLPHVEANMVDANPEIYNPINNDGGHVLNQDNRNETHQRTDSSQVIAQQPYVAGVLPDIAFQIPTAPGLNEHPYIACNYPNNMAWQMAQNYSWTAYNITPNTQNPTSSNPNPTAPLGVQMSSEYIQNTSSAKIIQDLAKSGNISNNMNDLYWIRSASGKHYEATINMQHLCSMGFVDKEKNLRLLEKFDNNINDVLQELLD